jgi:glycerol-3-phosphate dehydrogenase (NAD(P)+)
LINSMTQSSSAEHDSPLLILGAGAWGSALAIVAAQQGQSVRMWGHDPAHIDELRATYVNQAYLPDIQLPKSIEFYSDLSKACQHVRDVLVVVPSHAFADVIQALYAASAHPEQLTISIASKGIDKQTGQFLHSVVLQIFGAQTPVGVLSGPSFAKEVARQLPTAVTFATGSDELATRIVKRLGGLYFRIYHSDDIDGVALGGVLKNILAIAAGISDGLQLGANARSALITRGLAEMLRFGAAVHVKQTTLMGLAGVGDLILTCTDDQSRNRRFGRLLGQGNTPEQALAQLGCLVEGMDNVAQTYALGQHHHISLPITQEVNAIIHHGKLPRDAVNELLTREFKKE